jgi:hypothetical protein
MSTDNTGLLDIFKPTHFIIWSVFKNVKQSGMIGILPIIPDCLTFLNTLQMMKCVGLTFGKWGCTSLTPEEILFVYG